MASIIDSVEERSEYFSNNLVSIDLGNCFILKYRCVAIDRFPDEIYVLTVKTELRYEYELDVLIYSQSG